MTFCYHKVKGVKNMVQLLEHIGQHAGIGTKRKWVFVGCDGPPYCLASRLIDEHLEKYD